MHVQCPHCGARTKISPEVQLLNCPSCHNPLFDPMEATQEYDGRIDTRPAFLVGEEQRFRLLTQLGAGGFGEVWQALDTHFDRIVVLKYIQSDRPGQVSSEHLRREARLLAQLQHPNVLKLYDAKFNAEESFVTVEYIPGPTLKQWHRTHSPSVQTVAKIGVQLADALAHVHSRRIIHRDLKPTNIILDDEERPHIVDFGLAIEFDEIVEAGGTPAYMSPEQARGGNVDWRTDIFSLGLILYELLTGERAFPTDGLQDMLQRIIHQSPRPPKEINPQIPRELEVICLKCLEKDPDARYSSSQLLADQLNLFLSGERDASKHPTGVQGFQRWSRQHLTNEVQRLTAKVEALEQQVDERERRFLLAQQEYQLYQSLVASLPLGVYRKDYSKDPAGRFVFANDFFCKTIAQSPRSNVIGKSSEEIFSDRRAVEQQTDYDKHVIETGKPQDSQETHFLNGIETTFDVRRSPIRNFDGVIVGVQGLMWDVSAHAKMEYDLRAAKENAEKADRAKSDFVRNVSHEMRTPMNAILGMTELVLDTDLTSDQRNYLGMAQQASKFLLALINDILDFSKIKAEKLELHRTRFDLHDCIESTMRLLAHRAQKKSLHLACDIDADIPRYLFGDAGRLQQVLINLIGNAIKFTHQGEVSVRASVTSRTTTQIALRFRISDTGIGIPSSKLLEIFNPFEQVDPSTARRFEGTGLGLAIAAGIIQRMDGEIWASSPGEGQGSIFYFIAIFGLAADEPSDAVAEQSARGQEKMPSPISVRQQQILLVDDDAANQLYVSQKLVKLGHSVIIAASGRETLQILDHRRFDVILMDVQMPGMDGFETTKRIRDLEDRQAKERVPIIAMTAHAMNGDRDRCLAHGMDGYVSKPIDPLRLIREIDEVIKRADADSSKLVDQQMLLQRFGPDKKIVRRFVETFLVSCRDLITAVSDATQTNDSQALGRASHSLKGMISTLFGEHKFDSVLRLESMAKDSDLEFAAEVCRDLQSQMQQLKRSLEIVLKELSDEDPDR